MSEFDDAFAARVRDVFQDYQEPVDPAALARMRAALGHAPPVAPDRAPVARPQTRARRGLWVALAAAVVAVGVGTLAWPDGASPDAPEPIASAEAPGPAGAEEPAQLQTVDGTGGGPDSPDPTGAPLAGPSPGAASSRPSAGGRASAPPRPAPQDVTPPAASVPTPPAVTAPATPASTATSAPTQVAGAAAGSDPAGSDPAGSDPAGSDPVSPGPLATDAGTAGDVAAGLPPADPARPVLPALWTPEPVVPPNRPRQRGAGSPYRVEIATSTPLSGEASASGVGVAGGVTRAFPVAGPLSVSGGALLAYNRYDVERASALTTSSLGDLDPSETLDVPSTTRAETVALEIPLDLALTVAQTRSVRVGVSVGVTSAVYLAQEFDDQGTSYSTDPAGGLAGGVATETYRTLASEAPLSRVELARQLNLGVQLGRARGGVSADVFARVPLGGLTARDLGLTSAGLRLRVPLR